MEGRIRNWFRDFEKFLVRYLTAEVIAVVIGFALFFLFGDRTLKRICNILFFIGAVPVIVAFFILFGNWAGRGNFNYQYGRSMSPSSMKERFSQDETSFFKGMFNAFFLFITGITTVGMSLLIYLIFK